MKRSLTIFAALLLILILGSTISAQDEGEPDVPERDSVAVTIYNQGTALVQDRRTYTFEAGNNLIDFTDVASGIDATSVSFTSVTDPQGTRVLEQNYIYDLVNANALLERYLDETIRVTALEGEIYEGQLLSGRNDIILRTTQGEVVAIKPNQVRDIQFPNLPDGLITRPTLRWLIDSAAGGEQQVELTYLTNGLNWSADYNILLGTDDESLDLNGWVTLNNTSGTSYENALVKLVAGDVNRAPQARGAVADEGMFFSQAVPEADVAQRELFEYQLYELGRRVTVGNNETKQVEFVTGTAVPAQTFYVYDGSPQFFGYGGFNTTPSFGMTGVTDVQTFLEFTTDEEGGLGADLPAGRIRVYQEDIDGAALLIGENAIDHTPQGEDVQIFLGNAFDLVGERLQTTYNQLSTNVVEETFEIRLRNRKEDETVEIRIPERLNRSSNWQIIESSNDFTQTSAFAIEFRVEVAPGEERVITYTVRYTRP